MPMIELTPEQQDAFDSARGDPVVFDPRTKKEYVLIPATAFQEYLTDVDNDPEQAAFRRLARRNAAARFKEVE